MAVSFVNGFLCTSSCDVAKAKQGQDPHPAEHAARLRAERGNKDAGATPARDPSVIFGGSLSNLSDGNRVAPAAAELIGKHGDTAASGVTGQCAGLERISLRSNRCVFPFVPAQAGTQGACRKFGASGAGFPLARE